MDFGAPIEQIEVPSINTVFRALPARLHSASHQSGKSYNTQTHAADPAGQTTLGKSLVREEPKHTNTRSRPCRPDCSRQVTGQGRATTHKHMQPTLPVRPLSAGHQSGKSHNTQTHAADPAGQTALGKSPVKEEPQYTNARSRPCRPDRTRQVTGQGSATTHKHTQPTRPHSAGH